MVLDANQGVDDAGDDQDSTSDSDGRSNFGGEREAVAGIYGGWDFKY